jgi:hypothetical protein
MQSSPLAHGLLQPPQLCTSFDVSVQIPAHIVRWGAQLGTHRPLTHVPPIHTSPHVPQLFGSMFVLVQTATGVPQAFTL